MSEIMDSFSGTDLRARFPLANPRHRLAGYILEAVLATITLWIGWAIWSLVVWGNGQSPAKQVLQMRVIATDTGKPATWGHMAVRQILFPVAMYIPGAFIVGIGVGISGSNNAAGIIFTSLGYIINLAVGLVDILWIFRGTTRQRLTDVICKTQVLNIAG